jgi:hypothetical protein
MRRSLGLTFAIALGIALAPALACDDEGSAGALPPVDLAGVPGDAEVRFVVGAGELTADWTLDDGRAARLVLDLHAGRPLFARLGIGSRPGEAPRTIATNAGIRLGVTVGSRVGSDRWVFFDSPADRPHTRFDGRLALDRIRVDVQEKRHARIVLGTLTAGPFRGDLAIEIRAGSPLLHCVAEVSQPDPGVAFLYDAGLTGIAGDAVFAPPGDGLTQREPLGLPSIRPVAVRSRAVAIEPRVEGSAGGGGPPGALVVLPPPHAFFFARDVSTNLPSVLLGQGTVAITQAVRGGGNFSPWYDAPAGTRQRLDFFVLLGAGGAERALDQAGAYTHHDRFVDLPGHATYLSHIHPRLASSEREGRPNGPEFAEVMHRLNVNLVHLAEFHFEGRWEETGPGRIEDLRILFDVARRYSDDRLVLLPGEEGVLHLGGHFMLVFPRPVFFTWHRDPGMPFEENVPGVGVVYHLGGAEDVAAILQRESGRAWTSHPRIKASAVAPDAYREGALFQGPSWLGATFKAMPTDLSSPRLGDRALTLFDEMRGWGGNKRLIGEIDVFEIDRTHEVYAHANVNYLKLARLPPPDDARPVLAALDAGDFFTTTGEILLPRVTASPRGVVAEIHWTFPLDHARLVWQRRDGGGLEAVTFPLGRTSEHGAETMTFPLDLGTASAVRLEVWDVARDGAYTQWLAPDVSAP